MEKSSKSFSTDLSNIDFSSDLSGSDLNTLRNISATPESSDKLLKLPISGTDTLSPDTLMDLYGTEKTELDKEYKIDNIKPAMDSNESVSSDISMETGQDSEKPKLIFGMKPLKLGIIVFTIIAILVIIVLVITYFKKETPATPPPPPPPLPKTTTTPPLPSIVKTTPTIKIETDKERALISGGTPPYKIFVTENPSNPIERNLVCDVEIANCTKNQVSLSGLDAGKTYYLKASDATGGETGYETYTKVVPETESVLSAGWILLIILFILLLGIGVYFYIKSRLVSQTVSAVQVRIFGTPIQERVIDVRKLQNLSETEMKNLNIIGVRPGEMFDALGNRIGVLDLDRFLSSLKTDQDIKNWTNTGQLAIAQIVLIRNTLKPLTVLGKDIGSGFKKLIKFVETNKGTFKMTERQAIDILNPPVESKRTRKMNDLQLEINKLEKEEKEKKEKEIQSATKTKQTFNEEQVKTLYQIIQSLEKKYENEQKDLKDAKKLKKIEDKKTQLKNLEKSLLVSNAEKRLLQTRRPKKIKNKNPTSNAPTAPAAPAVPAAPASTPSNPSSNPVAIKFDEILYIMGDAPSTLPPPPPTNTSHELNDIFMGAYKIIYDYLSPKSKESPNINPILEILKQYIQRTPAQIEQDKLAKKRAKLEKIKKSLERQRPSTSTPSSKLTFAPLPEQRKVLFQTVQYNSIHKSLDIFMKIESVQNVRKICGQDTQKGSFNLKNNPENDTIFQNLADEIFRCDWVPEGIVYKDINKHKTVWLFERDMFIEPIVSYIIRGKVGKSQAIQPSEEEIGNMQYVCVQIVTRKVWEKLRGYKHIAQSLSERIKEKIKIKFPDKKIKFPENIKTNQSIDVEIEEEGE